MHPGTGRTGFGRNTGAVHPGCDADAAGRSDSNTPPKRGHLTYEVSDVFHDFSKRAALVRTFGIHGNHSAIHRE